MERKLTKQEVIDAFVFEGKKVRRTYGLYNYPARDGVFSKSIDEIERFYMWANIVDVKINGDIIDLIGTQNEIF